MSQNIQKCGILTSMKINEVRTIRKVSLTMEENNTYEIIKKLVETNGNKKTAALKIGCTERHINRLIKGYKDQGKEYFVHGNRNRQPATTLPNETRELIIDLYRNKYYDFNLTHFTEFLSEKEKINVSVSTVTSILRKEFIISPKANKSTRRVLKKELEKQISETKSKKEEEQLQKSILEIEDAHPRRPRCAFAGELVQMDASEHIWFGDTKTHLHAAIDDATGKIVGAYFDYQETLKGYYNVLFQILVTYGIPYRFLVDNRSVFNYKKNGESSVENDTFTQFGYACKQLGTDIQTTSVPQAKGRVERLFGTLQSRLIAELRLANVTSIEEANKYLYSYIKKFNKQFALPIDNITSVFEKQPDTEKINLTLARLSTRKIDNGCSIQYECKRYHPVNSRGMKVYFRKGTEVMVIKAFDNENYCSIDDQVYALELIPEHKQYSKDFDMDTVPDLPKKKYIPPMSHPWKQASFKKHMKNQQHV